MGIGPMHARNTPNFLRVEKFKLFNYTYVSIGVLADIITNFIAIIVRILKLSVGLSLGEHF